MSELLEKILSEDNIDLAIRQVKANKGSPGVDGMSVDEMEAFFKENGDFKADILNTMQTPILFALKNELFTGQSRDNQLKQTE